MIYLDIEGGPIAVRHTITDVNSQTIIFLHDSLGCIELWRDFPEQLAAITSCNFLIYDRHGYGKSGTLRSRERDNNYLEAEAAILDQIIDKFKLGKVILFGHSDGGSIALLAAANYPEKIEAVITEGAHIFVEDETLEGIRQTTELYNNTDLKLKLQKYHGAKTDDMFKAWSATWTSQRFRKWNIESCLSNISCPTLVLQGEDDEFGTLAQVNGITSNVSGSSDFSIIPGSRHTPHKENQPATLKISAEFIASIKK